MVGRYAFYDKNRAGRIVGSQRQNLLVLGRVVPTQGGRLVCELKHDQTAGPFTLKRVIGAAVNEKSAAVRSQSLIDPLEVFLNLRAEFCYVNNPNSVSSHCSPPWI